MYSIIHIKQKDPERVSKAERVGFEPTVPYGTRALQARALGRTMQPLHDLAPISWRQNYNMDGFQQIDL